LVWDIKLPLGKSTVILNGFPKEAIHKSKTGYTHEPVFMARSADKHSVFPGVHLVISLIKRLILGTFQGRVEQKYLARYLDEYVFRFNRRTTQSVGKRFWRMVQQLAASAPITNARLAALAIRPTLAD
jgi:hypothetical protein